jgi:murein DD-endopeptidase MepM/ murein hydrolase activator NlpD
VAIIGMDGVRYYGSHLQSIAPDLKVGMKVSAGQLLGHTGKSGDARFTAAHLHFGISHPTDPEVLASTARRNLAVPVLTRGARAKCAHRCCLNSGLFTSRQTLFSKK